MNAHTKQQQDKMFETDFIDSQKSDPPFAHILALSHIKEKKYSLSVIHMIMTVIADPNMKQPSKHAGSDSRPGRIGWEALARSGPDVSCTPGLLPDRIRLAKT